VASRRVAQFRKRVAAVLAEVPLDFFVDVVDELQQEHDGNLSRVAAALAFLAQQDKPLLPGERFPEPAADFAAPPARERGAERGARRDAARGVGRAGERGGDTPAPRRREPRPRALTEIELGGAMVPWRIEVGRDHEATPREIVGAIANEAGISSRYIGRIELDARHSTVELPADLAPEMLEALRRARVRQQALAIRRADATEVAAMGPARKRPPRRERDAPGERPAAHDGFAPPRRRKPEDAPPRRGTPNKGPPRKGGPKRAKG
jgi:ATP-dependent RNA helicase DeaD